MPFRNSDHSKHTKAAGHRDSYTPSQTITIQQPAASEKTSRSAAIAIPRSLTLLDDPPPSYSRTPPAHEILPPSFTESRSRMAIAAPHNFAASSSSSSRARRDSVSSSSSSDSSSRKAQMKAEKKRAKKALKASVTAQSISRSNVGNINGANVSYASNHDGVNYNSLFAPHAGNPGLGAPHPMAWISSLPGNMAMIPGLPNALNLANLDISNILPPHINAHQHSTGTQRRQTKSRRRAISVSSSSDDSDSSSSSSDSSYDSEAEELRKATMKIIKKEKKKALEEAEYARRLVARDVPRSKASKRRAEAELNLRNTFEHGTSRRPSAAADAQPVNRKPSRRSEYTSEYPSAERHATDTKTTTKGYTKTASNEPQALAVGYPMNGATSTLKKLASTHPNTVASAALHSRSSQSLLSAWHAKSSSTPDDHLSTSITRHSMQSAALSEPKKDDTPSTGPVAISVVKHEVPAYHDTPRRSTVSDIPEPESRATLQARCRERMSTLQSASGRYPLSTDAENPPDRAKLQAKSKDRMAMLELALGQPRASVLRPRLNETSDSTWLTGMFNN